MLNKIPFITKLCQRNNDLCLIRSISSRLSPKSAWINAGIFKGYVNYNQILVPREETSSLIDWKHWSCQDTKIPAQQCKLYGSRVFPTGVYIQDWKRLKDDVDLLTVIHPTPLVVHSASSDLFSIYINADVKMYNQMRAKCALHNYVDSLSSDQMKTVFFQDMITQSNVVVLNPRQIQKSILHMWNWEIDGQFNADPIIFCEAGSSWLNSTIKIWGYLPRNEIQRTFADADAEFIGSLQLLSAQPAFKYIIPLSALKSISELFK